MTKSMGTLVVVAGLMAVAGCAREDRWTLDGSRPSPLDDHKQSTRMVAPSVRTGQSAPVTAAPEEHSTTKGVELMQEGGYCFVRNTGNKAVEARVQVNPGLKNTPAELVRERNVLVPANSQVQIGRTSDGGEREWSYRLLEASHK